MASRGKEKVIDAEESHTEKERKIGKIRPKPGGSVCNRRRAS